MLPVIFTLIFILSVVAFLLYRKKHSKQRSELKSGDYAVIKSSFKKEFEAIPPNNVLHVLQVDDEYVTVEFLHFRNGKYQQQKIKKQYVRKAWRYAA